NKTNSAVQLKHVPTNIVVKCQATRSRDQNRKIARELLAQKIDDLAHGAQSRTAIVGDLKQKRAASKAKKARRKYKKLADAEAEAEGEGKEDGEDQQRGEEGEEEEEEKDGDWEKVDSERAPPDTEADNTKGER
ncbi:putative peptidyl-tRNA hydrolase, partial [Chaetomidium leptoderma]